MNKSMIQKLIAFGLSFAVAFAALLPSATSAQKIELKKTFSYLAWLFRSDPTLSQAVAILDTRIKHQGETYGEMHITAFKNGSRLGTERNFVDYEECEERYYPWNSRGSLGTPSWRPEVPPGAMRDSGTWMKVIQQAIDPNPKIRREFLGIRKTSNGKEVLVYQYSVPFEASAYILSNNYEVTPDAVLFAAMNPTMSGTKQLSDLFAIGHKGVLIFDRQTKNLVGISRKSTFIPPGSDYTSSELRVVFGWTTPIGGEAILVPVESWSSARKTNDDYFVTTTKFVNFRQKRTPPTKLDSNPPMISSEIDIKDPIFEILGNTPTIRHQPLQSSIATGTPPPPGMAPLPETEIRKILDQNVFQITVKMSDGNKFVGAATAFGSEIISGVTHVLLFTAAHADSASEIVVYNRKQGEYRARIVESDRTKELMVIAFTTTKKLSIYQPPLADPCLGCTGWTKSFPGGEPMHQAGQFVARDVNRKGKFRDIEYEVRNGFGISFPVLDRGMSGGPVFDQYGRYVLTTSGLPDDPTKPDYHTYAAGVGGVQTMAWLKEVRQRAFLTTD